MFGRAFNRTAATRAQIENLQRRNTELEASATTLAKEVLRSREECLTLQGMLADADNTTRIVGLHINGREMNMTFIHPASNDVITVTTYAVMGDNEKELRERLHLQKPAI